MKIVFASIDVEPDFGKQGFEGVKNLDKILSIFKKLNISLTIFLTGEILEKFPEKFKKINRKIEIASHSFTHKFWNTISQRIRKQELEKFITLYERIFRKYPIGFRAPSHIIDEQGLKLLEDKGFLYDSSVLPHYPFCKKYRGYKGRAPLLPYYPSYDNLRRKGDMKILEVPVRGQLFGIPLAGAWIRKLPFFIYKLLFAFYHPRLIVLNLHSWDVLDNRFLDKLEKTLRLLENKGYYFLTGEEISRKNGEIFGNKK